jgi:photosystem II stability/assembly factor-like uncharacterized protein
MSPFGHQSRRPSSRGERHAGRRLALFVSAAALLVALAAPATALGATWSAQRSGTTQALQAVDFVSAANGWAVGALGTILATADGGATWVPQASGTLNNLYDVQFVDATHGWVVGNDGTVLMTANGGATWTPQAFPTDMANPNKNHLRSVSFVDAMNGWAVGPVGVIITTANGGATWTRMTLPYGPDIDMTTSWTSIAMADLTHGWIVGENEVAYAPSPPPPNPPDNPPFWHLSLGANVNLKAIDHLTTAHAWAVGDAGKIFVTVDGVNWTPQTSGVTQGLTGVSALDALNVWALSGQGIVLSSVNGGASWQTTPIRLPYGFTSIDMVDATHGWVVGGRGLIYAWSDNGAKPASKALRNSTVKKGNVAKLRYRVDYPAGICDVTIKVTRKNSTVKTFKIAGAKVNSNLIKSFTCRLKKGTYTWHVTAVDPAGNAGPRSAVKKLFVR